MSQMLHLKVYAEVSTDLNALWDDISDFENVSLSGDGTDYVITYDGEQNIGLNILGACMAHSPYGKFYADYS